MCRYYATLNEMMVIGIIIIISGIQKTHHELPKVNKLTKLHSDQILKKSNSLMSNIVYTGKNRSPCFNVKNQILFQEKYDLGYRLNLCITSVSKGHKSL